VLTACGIMHRRCARMQHRRCITPQAVTQSSALEDKLNYRPKHVELIEIINKLLLLHLVGCLHY
jgi:beta-lactamase regulating signal transducer with metallopeptidase domain